MLSIIITAYNNKDFIEETINSILDSGKGFEFEILVGIDNCQITLNKCLDLYRKFGSNVKYFYFTSHYGTYVIRNTLVKISKYNKLLFFDSDDIMDENLISNIITNLDNYDYIKYGFISFKGEFKEKVKFYNKNNGYPKGSFGILKDVFLNQNGFEPWICAADGEFDWRVTSNNVKVKTLETVGLYYRIHSSSLTNKNDTSLKSSLRKEYHNIRDNKIKNNNNKPLEKLNIGEYITINNDNLNYINTKFKTFVLSIIIPTYKNTNYIDECIDSVIESTKTQNVEVLVGIDGCKETLEYVKQKSYPDNIKFYYFEKNVGPYIIKNSLSEIAIGENLIFFDSDDIMTQDMVSNSINSINHCDFIRHSYVNFTDPNKLNENKKREFEGGIFTIKKEVFEYMNGFEPWKCEADSEFALRMSKSKYKTKVSNNLDFFRRIHNEGLTSRTDTGYRSKLRAEYRKLYNNKKIFGPLPKKVTEPFTEIVVTRSSVTPQPQEPVKEKNHTLLSKLMNVMKIDPQPVQEQKTIDYDNVNETIRKRDIQKQEPKPINKNSNKGMAQNIKVSKNMNRPILLPKKPGGGSYRA
jgi:glycosyltransferase involved in cell wall biosynthesis